MNKQILKQIKTLQLGDLVRVEWLDASVGRSIGGGDIDVPVFSYGIYLGCLGKQHEHIILAQNSFRYSNGLFDVDYTAIPLTWSTAIKIVKKAEVNVETAQTLLTSFLRGNSRTIKRRKSNHERLG